MGALIVNAGSSSVKFSVPDMLDGMIDRIGSKAVLVLNGKQRAVRVCTYKEAGTLIRSLVQDTHITAVIHRVVHGGAFIKPTRITPAVRKRLTQLIPLAPLHNPPSLALIDALASLNVPQIACFDTMFHTTIPQHARQYALPKQLVRKHKFQRYGFHGLAHEAMAEDVARRMHKPLRTLNLITCQLGNGVSVCAIKHGKSIDTSMGHTPLEGAIMGTRCGSIDPAIGLLLAKTSTPDNVLHMLNTQSGLKGVGGSHDMRDLLTKKTKQAQLAIDMFCYAIKKYIGAYTAALGTVDAIVLGGGISQSPVIRKKILTGLSNVTLDRAACKKKAPVQISKKTPVWIVTVDEQAHMLRLSSALIPIRDRHAEYKKQQEK